MYDFPGRFRRTRILSIPILVLALLIVAACGEDSPVADNPGNGGNQPPPPDDFPDSAVVTVRLVAWDDQTGQGTSNAAPAEVDEVRFEISAPDITTQTRTVAVAQNMVEQTFTVGTGKARRITVEAFDAADSLLYDGTKFTDIADSALVTAVGMVTSTDDSPPVFTGVDGALAVSDALVLLSWPVATDGSDPDLEATYLIYTSTVSGDFDYSSPSYTAAPGETSYLVTDLDPGTTYYFVVRAMDRAGNITANASQQAITTPGTGGTLYVDVASGADNTGCGSSTEPCKTISYALSKSTTNQTIRVAKGVYGAAAGETFPLRLKNGTTLIGEGYWWNGIRVIKETSIEGPSPVIVGAANATVVSCYVRPTAWGTRSQAVYDDGNAMTVFHCTIDGVLSPSLEGVGFGGASSLIGSRVENFDGPAGRAVGVWGAGGALISHSLIVNNTSGIGLTASSCEISHCRVENTGSGGIGAGTSDYATDDLVFFRNHVSNTLGDGIAVMNVTDTKIIWNTVSDAGGYGIHVWNYQQPAHLVEVLSNSVTGGASAALHIIHGQVRANGNTFVCNAAGAFVRSDQVIDLRRNAWDHDPPTIDSGKGAVDPGCDGFFDICYEALYALTPEPLYQPDNGRGSCVVGIIPSSHR